MTKIRKAAQTAFEKHVLARRRNVDSSNENALRIFNAGIGHKLVFQSIFFYFNVYISDQQ